MIDLPKLLVRQEMVASFLGLRPHNNFLRIRNQSPEFEFICSWGGIYAKNQALSYTPTNGKSTIVACCDKDDGFFDAILFYQRVLEK